MGFNTTVFILNDRLNEIERDPGKFVAGIGANMYRGGETIGQTTVMPTEHADIFRLYGTHQNRMIDLSPWSPVTQRLVETHPGIVQSYIDQAQDSLNRLQYLLDERAGEGR